MARLNLPTEENQRIIAEALSSLAKDSDGEGKVDDFSNSPGRNVLMAGDRDYGFFGPVQAKDFGLIKDNPDGEQEFNGKNLALAIGLTSGTAQHSETPWLKFMDGGDVYFVPQKTIRYGSTWNAIYNQGAVYGDGSIGVLPPNGRIGDKISVDGDKNAFIIEDHESHWRWSGTVIGSEGDTIVARGFDNDDNNGEFKIETVNDTELKVDGSLKSEDGNKKASVHRKSKEVKQDREVTIGDHTFAVEVLKGGASDPLDSYSDSDRGLDGSDSQWNHLILPLHERAKNGDWNYKSYAGDVEDWGFGLNDEDLMTHHDFGSGSRSWCKETRDTSSGRRLGRGYGGASDGGAGYSWGSDSHYGWRVALRLLSK